MAAAVSDDGAIDPELRNGEHRRSIENAEELAETDADPASPTRGDQTPNRPARSHSGKWATTSRAGPAGSTWSLPGDTLWDISDAYLGTPWVWPSVWTDNRDIENPHLIVPGDRIWISAHEMRRVSAEEAERLLSGQPLAADGDGESAGPASDSFQALFQDEDEIEHRAR